mmetsp:Transcript_84019/g.271604  ORF Transcript_84019/g.271604 Transcript_84019/m.271604 type:complete len:205 (-) Transcript_84019:138-752(-)
MARRSAPLLLVLCAVVAALLRVACQGLVEAFVGPALRSAAPRTLLRAECMGRVRGDGSWTAEDSMPIESEEEENIADEVWTIFEKAYPNAAKTGIFIDTPVESRDVKYRWRRMKKTMDITSQEALEVVKVDPIPLVVDADYVQLTWDAMVRGSSKDEALGVVMNNPGVVTAGDDIEKQMAQAKVAGGFIAFTRPLNKVIQGLLR